MVDLDRDEDDETLAHRVKRAKSAAGSDFAAGGGSTGDAEKNPVSSPQPSPLRET